MQVLSFKSKSGSILVPVGLVAQITGREGYNTRTHDLPFIRSQIRWREFEVPMVFASEMLDADVGADDSFTRSVILWPMKGCKNTELFALSSLDSPKVIEIGEDTVATDIAELEGQTNLVNNKFTMGLVKLDNQTGIIPDLMHLAGKIF
jgi:hypothetical protein